MNENKQPRLVLVIKTLFFSKGTPAWLRKAVGAFMTLWIQTVVGFIALYLLAGLDSNEARLCLYSEQPSHLTDDIDYYSVSKRMAYHGEMPWYDLERPNMFVYTLLVAVTLAPLILSFRSPAKLKQRILCPLYLTTFAIRIFGARSAWDNFNRTEPYKYTLVQFWHSASALKIFFLVALIYSLAWGLTYLGDYEDLYFDMDTKRMKDQNGFTQRMRPWAFGDASFLTEPSIAVRLAYIHVVDSTIHVLWLRYYCEYGTYTPFVNNQELFTIALAVQMAIYTYARMASHVHLKWDVELGQRMWRNRETAAFTQVAIIHGLCADNTGVRRRWFDVGGCYTWLEDQASFIMELVFPNREEYTWVERQEDVGRMLRVEQEFLDMGWVEKAHVMRDMRSRPGGYLLDKE
ncbi:hypothetical protein BDV95DRAFT_603944 [Massariosphaeria phaeospora]|uniref:Uncharacterized protein n=1 Tax=Massariosphaeria phaeospora TaxID=100035 RepID=A0A7C8MEU0_9PLEO|nr:hypothetical protein BDV95DRAFT_603944 [Massariosphaeria phaeospora]